jgi:Mg-chelatase subunit ChlD
MLAPFLLVGLLKACDRGGNVTATPTGFDEPDAGISTAGEGGVPGVMDPADTGVRDAFVLDVSPPSDARNDANDMDSGPSDAESDAPVDEDAACAVQGARSRRSNAILQILLDRSGSMASVPPNPPGETRSKLIITRDALIASLGLLPDTAAVGLSYYPALATPIECMGITGTCCVNGEQVVPIDLLGMLGGAQRTTLETTLAGATTTGDTPTYEAFVHSVGVVRTSPLMGSKFVVLLTDGAPNTPPAACLPTTTPVATALIEVVQRAFQQRVSTFIIGSPGSEGARASLSRMAEAGGTARRGCSHTGPDYCHFDMATTVDFAVSLTEALQQITERVVACSFDIPEPPTGETLDRDRVNVQYTSGGGDVYDVFHDESSACAGGWQYEGDRIELCPEMCALVTADPDAAVDILFGCATKDVDMPGQPPSEPH